MTQCEKVLKHLKERGGITSLEAMQNYGIMRLASRVNDLRRQGVPIRTACITGKNRYGEKIHFTEYFLEEEA